MLTAATTTTQPTFQDVSALVQDMDATLVLKLKSPALALDAEGKPLNDLEHHAGYPVAALERAYDKASDPADRRAPIRVIVEGRNVGLMGAALQFFTGCKVYVIAESATFPHNGEKRYTLACAGYRMGPCGP